MKSATEIAKANLLNCFQEEGITASTDHFNDFWARDSFYASRGALEIGETGQVKENLSLFIKYQKENGQIPRRIDRFFVMLNYLGIKIKRKKIKPEYKGAYIFPALDPNILFIITYAQYFEKTGDREFIDKNFENIQRALEWLEKYDKNGLLNEEIFANWMDVIVKRGAVLYTNVLYFEALNAFTKICVSLGRSGLSQKYANKALELKNKINGEYWNGEYYADWIKGNKKYQYFSTEGNVLAMLFGISSQEKNEKIIGQIEKWQLDEIPLKTNYPDYPWWRVAIRMYLIGTPGYQNNYASWLWLGCVYAVALKENGYADKAEKVERKITAKIEEYQKVYEIYAPDGKPYNGWFWKSAVSFAWSSGLYLWMKARLPK